MLKPTLSINSSFAEQKNNQDYFVFILLGKNYLQIASTLNKGKKIELIEEYHTGKKNLTKQEVQDILSAAFIKNAKKITIGLDSAKSALIPNELYHIKEKATYLKELYQLEKTEVYAAHKIESLHITDVFSIKEGTYKLLESIVPNVTIKHSKAALLNAYLENTNQDRKYTGFIYQTTDSFWLSILNRDKLLLHNNYYFQDPKDVLYQLLNAIKQLNIPKTEIGFQLGGEAADYQLYNHILSEQNIINKNMTRLKSLFYPEQITDLPEHKFFNLFALITCA